MKKVAGDIKKHGFDLERTQIQHSDQLSRLTYAVALLYVWPISIGARIMPMACLTGLIGPTAVT